MFKNQKKKHHLNVQTSKIRTFKNQRFKIYTIQMANFHKFKLPNFKNTNMKFKIQKQKLNLQMFELYGSASFFEYKKNVKLRRKRFHMKDTGKSYSIKLRHVI